MLQATRVWAVLLLVLSVSFLQSQGQEGGSKRFCVVTCCIFPPRVCSIMKFALPVEANTLCICTSVRTNGCIALRMHPFNYIVSCLHIMKHAKYANECIKLQTA